MFIKILLVALSSIVISTNSFAESINVDSNKAFKDRSPFIFVNFSSEEKEMQLIPYDKIVIDKTNSNIRSYWSIFVNQNNKIPFDMVKVYQKIDCAERKKHRLQISTYSNHKLIQTSNVENDKESIKYVIPDTVDDFATNLVCNAEDLTSAEWLKILFFSKDQKDFFNEVQETISFLLKEEMNNK